ncbi:hypothetical protein Bca52824_010577 [Brassica carinata]|uniref:Uncharacterized protein n=1 Tax=Brassica carinata TaxID=52824 RepID=A0A8X8B7T0_BRACI|nr:hypothetical protein Bca52824_010577 [Brassica carinata]
MKLVQTSGKSPVALYFKDILLGSRESELYIRLIYSWEASNGGALIGLEVLIIDEQSSILSGIDQMCLPMDDDDRFRVHVHEDFESNCGLRGDLYDVVGHMKLLNGQLLIHRPVLDEVEIANTFRVLIHLQTKDNNVLEIHGQCRHSPHPFGADCESITYWCSMLFLATGTLALSSMSTFNCRELTRKHASEMVDKYFEVQGESFWTQLKGRIQAITAMKVVSPSVLHPLTSPVGIPLAISASIFYK